MQPEQLSAILDDQGRYTLKSFDKKPPFSSFLPGIAGPYGIPLWVFYTNRGQAISSFGIKSKDHPLMEFQPANKSYQLTSQLGFRTFLKLGSTYLEPFSPWSQRSVRREMYIGLNELEIRELDLEAELETRVRYFTIANQPFGGLVRSVNFHYQGSKKATLDVLDGMPAIIPAGADNGQLKHIGRTIEAWMEVILHESDLAFFRLRASAEDTSEVQAIDGGNYALAAAGGKTLSAIVDPAAIFAHNTSFSRPEGFPEGGLDNLPDVPQVKEGRTPCAFFSQRFSLQPGQEGNLTSLYGYLKHDSDIPVLLEKVLSPQFFSDQHQQSRTLALELTDPTATRSNHPLFDAYCRQTFLDNLMRGGWPLSLDDKKVYHIYSRKHGDPERDYNHYYLAPEFYSQGNGNYRDINQNRRHDLLFNPEIRDFNIRLFMSLIQLDGYNPLVIEGSTFSIAAPAKEQILSYLRDKKGLEQVLDGNFTLGQVLDAAFQGGLEIPLDQFLAAVVGASEQHIQAVFGEGYWIDHWTYNLDLIESYLAIFPDQEDQLLFNSDPLPFYDSPAVVNPRSKKYVLAGGKPSQLNAVIHDEEKERLIKARESNRNWVRADHGRGDIFRLPLISKLVLLAILKFSSRDPDGLGIEMEAGKPGWYDALNGLPGMFGSSLPESFELLRLLEMLLTFLEGKDKQVRLPLEVEELLEDILLEIDQEQSAFAYWDAVSTARESYREKIRMGVSGKLAALEPSRLIPLLKKLRQIMANSLERAVELGDGIAPTYFYYQLDGFTPTRDNDPSGRTIISAMQFTRHLLPHFLEGPVHQMKVLQDQQQRSTLADQIRSSQLFDSKLKMYKLNESILDQPHAIGRARAFSRGWLENESIWMHMSYKYLLELLKAGLYEQFSQDFQHHLPPFLDPAVYGRSPLENSSFIVSSAHPDPALHGRGHVARLTGATAEFIDIWYQMVTGGKPFRAGKDNELIFRLSPKIPGWLFSEKGIFAYNILGRLQVRIINPSRLDTWSQKPLKYHLIQDGSQTVVSGSEIQGSAALGIRNGNFQLIEVYF